ncbi:hypothetical protein CBL_11792 [Carabus blaptoides fortunei]
MTEPVVPGSSAGASRRPAALHWDMCQPQCAIQPMHQAPNSKRPMVNHVATINQPTSYRICKHTYTTSIPINNAIINQQETILTKHNTHFNYRPPHVDETARRLNQLS